MSINNTSFNAGMTPIDYNENLLQAGTYSEKPKLTNQLQGVSSKNDNHLFNAMIDRTTFKTSNPPQGFENFKEYIDGSRSPLQRRKSNLIKHENDELMLGKTVSSKNDNHLFNAMIDRTTFKTSNPPQGFENFKEYINSSRSQFKGRSSNLIKHENDELLQGKK